MRTGARTGDPPSSIAVLLDHDPEGGGHGGIEPDAEVIRCSETNPEEAEWHRLHIHHPERDGGGAEHRAQRLGWSPNATLDPVPRSTDRWVQGFRREDRHTERTHTWDRRV